MRRGEATHTYRAMKTKMTLDFLSETKRAERQWSNGFNSLKYYKLASYFLYPAKISFKPKGKRLFLPQANKSWVNSLAADQSYKKNIKRNSSGRKKIPEGNLDLHKIMKNIRNDKYVRNIKRSLFLILNPFEETNPYTQLEISTSLCQ